MFELCFTGEGIGPRRRGAAREVAEQGKDLAFELFGSPSKLSVMVGRGISLQSNLGSKVWELGAGHANCPGPMKCQPVKILEYFS